MQATTYNKSKNYLTFPEKIRSGVYKNASLGNIVTDPLFHEVIMRNAVSLNELPDHASEKEVQPKISIIIPVYNEESFLVPAASELYENLQETGIAFELILCENGSTDRTMEVAEGLANERDHIKVLSSDAPDYGRAMRAGVLASNAPYVFVFDIDYHSTSFLKKALALLEDYDIVIGSKLAPGTSDNRSLLRKIITRGFSFSLKTLFNVKVKETHGIKAFRREAIEPVLKRTLMAKDLFDTELVIRAERGGLGIKEIPVTVEEKRPTRSSVLKRIPRTIIGLLMLRYLLWKERFSKIA